jgi:hypothetical protein
MAKEKLHLTAEDVVIWTAGSVVGFILGIGLMVLLGRV